MQNVQRVQNVLHQISNVAAALLNLPKQLPAPLPQNHSCHQGDLQWRRHKVVNVPAIEDKNICHPTFQGWGDFTHARIKRHILPPHRSNSNEGSREMEEKNKMGGFASLTIP